MVNRKFRHNFTKIIDLDEEPSNLHTIIWMSRASPPPSRMDESVLKHSEVGWNAKINLDSLPTFINNQNKSFMQIDYAAEMKCSGGSTEFYIFHNGRRQAVKNVSVEFHDQGRVGI